ncbi:MAG: hypothetical protein ACYSU7_07760 [Planctomycetota bacterium]|jgi:hypothetical protein
MSGGSTYTWLETIGGLWELVRLAAGSGFRLRGPYWRWRHETAFGSDPGARPSRWQRALIVLDYGRWVYRMKRGRWH